MLLRYILSSHLKISSMILFLGVVVYFLAEIFEKLDGFSEAGTDTLVVLFYFLLRMPGMITTILPAVFFLATIILLCNMAKSRELLALQAGGISIYKLLKIVVIFAITASFVQFIFSQFIATEATVQARMLRTQEMKDINLSERPIHNVWFKHNNWIVHIASLKRDGSGNTLRAMHLDEKSQAIIDIIKADTFQINDGRWELFEVNINTPHKFTSKNQKNYTLPIQRAHSSFFAIDSDTDLQDLPADQLYFAINELKDAGANVESLETAFQSKFAYAGSIISLVFLAFAIFTLSPNVYIGASVGTFSAFMAYIFIMVTDTLGQDGRLSPIMAAWLPHITIILVSLTRILVARK